jgi:hypothetical protein
VSLLLPANCLTVAFILANFARHLHIFFGARLACGPPSLRPCAFYICFARNACGLARLAALAIYICLLAALGAGCQAPGVDPKKMGAAAPTDQSTLTLTLPAIHLSAMWSGIVRPVVTLAIFFAEI